MSKKYVSKYLVSTARRAFTGARADQKTVLVGDLEKRKKQLIMSYPCWNGNGSAD